MTEEIKATTTVKMENVRSIEQAPEKTRVNVIYRYPHRVMRDDIIALFEGKMPVSIIELFDADGRLIATNVEDELRRRGASFVKIRVSKDLKDDLLKKSRIDGSDCPFTDSRVAPASRQAIEQYEVQGIVNVKDWQAIVDRRRAKHGGVETGWKASESRANGIQNSSSDSTVVCEKIIQKTAETRYYVNYLVLRYLTKRVVIDGATGADITEEVSQFVSDKTASREREAEKHGIEVDLDPQIRQMKFSNIAELAIEGRVYIPTE
jgi:hypothetical protein